MHRMRTAYASGTGWRPPPAAAAGAAAGSGSGAGAAAGALTFCCFAKSRGLVAYFFPSALQRREWRAESGEWRGRERRAERGNEREGREGESSLASVGHAAIGMAGGRQAPPPPGSA